MKEGQRIYSRSYEADGVKVTGDFYIADGNSDDILIAGYFDRAKAKVKSIACTFGRKNIKFGYGKHWKTINHDYKTVYKPVKMGRDRFVYGLTISKEIGKRYIITTEEFAKADFFQFMMKAGKIPLLEEWQGYLYDYYEDNSLINIYSGRRARDWSDYDRTLPIHGKQVKLDEIVVIDAEYVTNGSIKEVVSAGLKAGRIKITDSHPKPLDFTDFDSYIQNYGASMVKNLEEEIEPLSPLKGVVDSVAFKHKRLFPQQAACINGMMALKKSGSKYGLMVEGMGCGKTLQGAGTVDAYFNAEWLRKNPGKSLRDLYLKDEVKYRNIMMAPSHLVEKWKEEILNEIPNAKVTILDDLSKLSAIKDGGIKRTGREWYLISKDTCKLSYQYSPIPSVTAKKPVSVMYCKDCAEVKKMIPKRGVGKDSVCPDCGGKHFTKVTLDFLGSYYGMVCPCCGEILLKYSSDIGKSSADYQSLTLKPSDFANKNTSNSTCYHCGAPLWGADAKPIDMGGEYSRHVTERKSPWYKIAHWKNVAKKSKKTAFVLRGHEPGYLKENKIKYELIDGELSGDFEVSKREYGPRKVAPAAFIKKRLKGFFDFCILDECHKYENGGTAQSNAAHALMGASDFTLCLTGTISNGKADSFFYLLYMLDPRRMRKMGYGYEDVTEFVKKYGTLETVYEIKDDGGTYNACSRGRVLQSPRVKPGISPLLFVDFLLDKAVFLDLSDLSKYIPSLKEEVELVKLPKAVDSYYNQTIDELKDAMRGPEGRAVLSNILQFGLSYPDKPYGRSDILSTLYEDSIVGHVENLEEYSNPEVLLPKEEKLVELVNKEISEERNCFVYCCYTGEGSTNVTGRLKDVIEKNCNLTGRVQILNSNSPEPTKRERWIKQKASEGMKVFICNPKCVETGLDFCFNFNGKAYNYPTLIFYQINYELAVIWQASRRHYRLNQTKDCRTYYLAYEGTLQAAAIEIMAEKEVAASAIQGKFSAEGLAAMAQGVDPRLKLAEKLSKGDNSDRKSLENMFDAINQANNEESEEDSAYEAGERAKTYYEVMGYDENVDETSEEKGFDLFSLLEEDVNNVSSIFNSETTAEEPEEKLNIEDMEESDISKEGESSVFAGLSLFDLFGDIEIVSLNDTKPDTKPSKTKKNKKTVEGQLDFLKLYCA